MGSEQENINNREKTRLCPSCRMSISILATKCRFCGETVGRPKEEARSLSIEDLGGETIVHYAPSSNVMEALESFRMEEVAPAPPPEPKKMTLFGRKANPQDEAGPASPGSGLPELDERSKALAALMTPARPVASSRRASEPTWMKKMAFFGAFVAVIVILYFGSMQVGAMIRGWGVEEVQKPKVVSHVAQLIAANAPALDIHKEAYTVYQKDASASNHQNLADARQRVIDEVEELLNSPSVTVSTLRRASNQANTALALDPSDEMRMLKEEVDRENQLYNLSVVSFGPGSPPESAILKLHDGSQVTVKKNEKVHDRFVVQLITDRYVRLIDTQRKTSTAGLQRSVQVGNDGIPR